MSKSKWKCADDSCGNKCETSDKLGLKPRFCPHTGAVKNWQPVELVSNPEQFGNSEQLPKLTADVFRRPDCPDMATFAIVYQDGSAAFMRGDCCDIKPTERGCWEYSSASGVYQLCEIPGKFDASDWQNSLIKRPCKLPEWCKVGEWVYNRPYLYRKILGYENGNIVFSGDLKLPIEGISDFVAARLRPWKGSESLNKVVITGGDTFGVVIGCTWNMANVSGQWINCKKLLADDYKQPDSSPCGVLEHLENGEWVK